MADYAPNLYRALNGVFCIYKSSGNTVAQVITTLQTNLARAMNELPCRPVRERAVIHSEHIDTDLSTVTTVPDLADHPLVVGPRYIADDFHIRSAGMLGKHASGVLVMGVGRGTSLMPAVAQAKYLRVYHVQGQLGLATQNYSPVGKIVQKTTYHHVTQARIDRVVAGMQAGHQKHMFIAAGVDIKSQEAYELASRGLLRPAAKNLGPVVYGMKCTAFDPPNFTLEVHAVDEPSWYLMKLVHEVGLQARSSAVCTRVRRVRYAHFELAHALLLKHCTAQAIVDNIALCRSLLSAESLRKTRQIECGGWPARVEPLGLIEGEEEDDVDVLIQA